MLVSFLKERNVFVAEGFCQQVPQQVEKLTELVQKPVKTVMEIGFNAGHSSDLFLSTNDEVKVVSFDIASHHYVHVAKEYMDKTYPDRHTLILGNSTVTIPEYINQNPDTCFDFIFIDGGHQYEVARADLENCSKLAHKDTIVILDDTIFTAGLEQDWTTGPSRAWTELINSNRVVQLGSTDYEKGRGMSWGKYILN